MKKAILLTLIVAIIWSLFCGFIVTSMIKIEFAIIIGMFGGTIIGATTMMWGMNKYYKR